MPIMPSPKHPSWDTEKDKGSYDIPAGLRDQDFFQQARRRMDDKGIIEAVPMDLIHNKPGIPLR